MSDRAGAAQPQPPTDLLELWRVTPVAYLGGKRNQHWLVHDGLERLVLLSSATELDYELSVQRQLLREGWPVAAVVAGPRWLHGRAWCLSRYLPGEPLERTPREQRRRGLLLAELHQVTARLGWLGQRAGYAHVDAIVADPALDPALTGYERVRPEVGRALRRHLDWTREALARLDLSNAPALVLHGDFITWNLLFQEDHLTGVLDFEFTHLDYRVADFALAWRGDQDEVLAGYEDVQPLTELEWQLLVPVFWCWLFKGVRQQIDDIMHGRVAPHGFDWQLQHLLRRSEAMRLHVGGLPVTE